MAKHNQTLRHAAKLRILAAAREDRDWRSVASAHEVNERTAANWVSTARTTDVWEPARGTWGGHRYRLMREEIVDHLEGLISVNPHFTLVEMADSIDATFSLRVSPQTVKNTLDGRLFSLKKLHNQPNYMNREENKLKRREYLRQLIDLTADGKTVFYLDETNFNVWCSRMYGRSKVGQRATSVRAISQGQDMHVIACISKDGVAYWERRFGSFKKPDCDDVVRKVLRCVRETHALSDVVLVLDNAPCHRGVEAVFEESEFQDATLLRLGPYSPMLNPIENVFSVFKAEVKRYLGVRREQIIAQPPAGSTIKAHRARFLENAADHSLPLVATAALCGKCHRHTMKFYERVWDLSDMPVGN